MTKLSTLSRFQTDKEAEVNGRWFPWHEFKLKIARWPNEQFSGILQRQLAPYMGKFQDVTEAMNRPEVLEIMHTACAKWVLLDWEGIGEPNAKGEIVAVPYSVEKAKEYFKAFEVLYKNVMDIAMSEANFRIQQNQDDVKN